jgi:ABC-2 type transport system ATP-binding protein
MNSTELEPIIQVNNLWKSFSLTSVLNGFNIQVNKGSIIGLLGKNGAGKTTLLQTLVGLLKPNHGSSQLLQQDSWNLNGEAKQKIGYVAQVADLIPWMTVEEMIQYISRFYDHWNSKKVNELLLNWELFPEIKVENLSTGQKQKLSIILAMGHEPELLILDEPVASLDPIARRGFIKELIEMNAEQNKTILFSTHIVSDLERVAAEVIILKDGKNFYQGDLDELKEKIVRIHVTTESNSETELNLPGVISKTVTDSGFSLVVEDIRAINLKELELDLNVTMQVESLSLEEIFLAVHL